MIATNDMNRRTSDESTSERKQAKCAKLKGKKGQKRASDERCFLDNEEPMLLLGNNSNSSNETVIARFGCKENGDSTDYHKGSNIKPNHSSQDKSNSTPSSSSSSSSSSWRTSATSLNFKHGVAVVAAKTIQAQTQTEQEATSCKRNKTLKNILHLAGQHFSVQKLLRNSSGQVKADHSPQKKQQQQQRRGTNQKVKCAVYEPNEGESSSLGKDDSTTAQAQHSNQSSGSNAIVSFAQRYLLFSFRGRGNGSPRSKQCSRSAPVTPLKSAALVVVVDGQQGQEAPSVLVGGERCMAASTQTSGSLENLTRPANCCRHQQQQQQQAEHQKATKPSVRFVEEPDKQEKVEAGEPASSEREEEDEDEEMDGLELVAKLFQLPGGECDKDGQRQGYEESDNDEGTESPMDSRKFRSYGYKLIDYICNYLDTIRRRRVTPINIEPGYLKSLIEAQAPEKGQSFAKIMHDFEAKIMCGITHWQHPHFHAYFPAGNAYPSILADMLSDALGCVGFSWAASPAYTELEIIMLDWMGKMIGLPEEFLCLSSRDSSSGSTESKGGGVIQGSASECVLVNLLAARHWAMEKLRKKYPTTPDGLLLSKLIGYCSKEAHSCVEKAAMIGFIRMRALETDEKHSLRGETLAKAIEADTQAGLEPFIVCATLGTTSCVSFDNLQELGEVCRQNGELWLHVDAAYAGSALICPEFKYLMRGIEMASSFNMNPNKWMLINFDCSLMWVKDRFKLTRAFVVDPLYLQHSFSDQAIDYRHWGIPLSRRFRALKLWFVIRNYGVEGLRSYIRNHCRLAKMFEQLIRQDPRFMVTNEVVLGLVCFRLVGSNALNQRLLSMINASGKLHMVPASLNGRYVIRFCVCDQNARDQDIHYAYKCISDMASELFESIRAGRERIRAISQQNTIDVSSISLHTQQSASADRLNGQASSAAEEAAATSGPAAGGQEAAAVARRSVTPATRTASSAASRSPLMKQVSVQHSPALKPNGASESTTDEPEQEIAIESLASIDGQDFDLELEEDEEDVEGAGDDLSGYQEAEDELRRYFNSSSIGSACNGPQEQGGPQANGKQPTANSTIDSMSPMQRAIDAAADEHEAADEIVKLVGRRNRMSLRYKREFFVRVVSDPRVYRASISGDINAHQSTGSLGGQQQHPHHQLHSQMSQTTTTTTSTTTGVCGRAAATSE